MDDGCQAGCYLPTKVKVPALQLAYELYEGTIAGVDEAGRGPLAGPVVAAAVVLDPARPIEGLNDSKRLSAARREALAEEIEGAALHFGLGRAEVCEIDDLNILQASLLAMQRAVAALGVVPSRAFIDGNIHPSLPCRTHAIVKGDAIIAEIAAASVLAKVSRDREMCALDERYPNYGFARHKGYPTAEHVRQLKAFGVCPVHRRSFAPVRCLLSVRVACGLASTSHP